MDGPEVNADRITTPSPFSWRTGLATLVSSRTGEVVSTAPQPSGDILPNFPPFVLRWDESANPLPRRAIRPAARLRARLPQLDPPAWVPTGALDQPFDFCGYVQRLCADIVAGRPEFLHIDPSCLLFGVTQARSGRVHGLQARVTPLRFRGGAM